MAALTTGSDLPLATQPAGEFQLFEIEGLCVSYQYGFLSALGEYLESEELYPLFGTQDRKSVLDLRATQALPVRTMAKTCLVFQNWGISTWGHFLIFMLPRLMVAEQLGAKLKDMKVLMSNHTPQWQFDALEQLFGISRQQVEFFDPWKERIVIENAIVPQMLLTSAGFHPQASGIFSALRKRALALPMDGFRRDEKFLLIDRTPYVKQSVSQNRRARNFDQLAASLRKICAGVFVADPSGFSLARQATLFAGARIIVGEYGSALHNSIFGKPSQIVVSIGELNELQSRICALMGQTHVVVPLAMTGEYDIPVEAVCAALEPHLAAIDL